jgi:prepilin-type N-terminal cleavage/methylation domain-containing protein
MRNLYKRKRQEGFTIIEVMIVLAIAAVILLIVLLAVPALQRNSRNTQRANDAATLAAAVNTCLANHNNLTTSCDSIAASEVDIDTTKLGQLTAPAYSAAVSTGSTTAMNWSFARTCDAAGTADSGTGTSRQFAVVWQNERTSGTDNRCIDS